MGGARGGVVESARRVHVAAVALLAGLLGSVSQTAVVSPLPIVRGDEWHYLPGRADPPTDWALVGFDDRAWPAGPSGFGYGDEDDATVLMDMSGRYLSLYTRREFDVPPGGAPAGLDITIDWDDGFIAYVNGREVARRNLPGLPGSPVAHDVLASPHEASAGQGGLPERFHVGPAWLLEGRNAIAVQAHNNALDSSDLTLIVEVRATNPPPLSPISVSPRDAVTDAPVDPLLCVDVADPTGEPLTVTFRGREVTVPGSRDFTVVALPDTQYYAASYPETYLAQTRWIVEQRVPRGIAFVTQLGDCVDRAEVEQQWVNADAAWSLVEDPLGTGLVHGIPYGIAAGNHDQYPGGVPGTLAAPGTTTSAYNRWFGVERFSGRSYYGGHFGDNNDNHYETFRAGGMDFLAIHMEFMPADSPLRRAVLAWADALLRAYPSHRALVTSHYLMEGGLSTAFSDQGQATYDALKGNPNLFLMLCGHLDITQRREDVHDGRAVHTLRSDYQYQTNGGNGWLRILTFRPDADVIEVETYSPVLDLWLTDDLNRFTIPYEMDGGVPFATIGSASASSGARVCVAWPGRRAGRTYEWYAVASDGTTATAGPRWGFVRPADPRAERSSPRRVLEHGRSAR